MSPQFLLKGNVTHWLVPLLLALNYPKLRTTQREPMDYLCDGSLFRSDGGGSVLAGPRLEHLSRGMSGQGDGNGWVVLGAPS